MTLDFFKKRKQAKEELQKIREIIKKIEIAQERAKVLEEFQLIESKYGESFLTSSTQKSIEEKKSFYINYAYQLLTNWDNYGNVSIELGKWLEDLISKEDIQVGIHRTGGYGMIDPNNIYTSSTLYNIFKEGLYITGDIGSGVNHKEQVLQPNKNITPLNNILEGIMFAKSQYKHSTGGVITVIPSKYVTACYDLKKDAEQEIYIKVDNQWTLKPEYLIGFIAQDKGVCTFYSKEDILNNYKEKDNSKQTKK